MRPAKDQDAAARCRTRFARCAFPGHPDLTTSRSRSPRNLIDHKSQNQHLVLDRQHRDGAQKRSEHPAAVDAPNNTLVGNPHDRQALY